MIFTSAGMKATTGLLSQYGWQQKAGMLLKSEVIAAAGTRASSWMSSAVGVPKLRRE
jgi:hypothetical protein